MRRLDATPWADAALGKGLRDVVRDRIPLGYNLSLSGRTSRGPWRVLLLRDSVPIFDHWYRDIEVGCGEALASIAPTDLENELAASLRARRVSA